MFCAEQIQIVDEFGQIMILRNFFQGKALKKSATRAQPQSVKEYIHVVLGICAKYVESNTVLRKMLTVTSKNSKMNLTKEAAAIKVRFDEYFNPPKWQAVAVPREKPTLSASLEIKKTPPTLDTNLTRSVGFVPRSGSPELESPRLSTSPTDSESGSTSLRKRISIGRAPQKINAPSVDVQGHSPRSTSLMNLGKDSEEQDLNKVRFWEISFFRELILFFFFFRRWIGSSKKYLVKAIP